MIVKAVLRSLAFAAAFFLAGFVSNQASAGEVMLARAVGGVFNVQVTSLKEARFTRVIKQQYDFSCGSGALATLLTYHYDIPVNETEVFTEMFEVGDQERIEKYGFSLLDMKTYLQHHDLRADGFRISLEKLADIGVPAIALIQTSGYKHFVVVKGVSGDEVLLGDPARGTRTMRHDDFVSAWNGIAFVIRDKASVAKTYFNNEEDWAVLTSAPFGTAMARQSLSSFSVHLKGTMANTF